MPKLTIFFAACFLLAIPLICAAQSGPDFSDIIKVLDRVEFSNSNKNARDFKGDLLVDQLSEDEQRFLAEYVVKGKLSICLASTITHSIIYREKFKAMPENGLSLLRIANQDAYDYYIKHPEDLLANEKNLAPLSIAINPMDGHLFGNLNPVQGSPFSFSIERVAGPEGIRQILETWKQNATGSIERSPYRTWIIRVYGENGRQIIEDTIWRPLTDEDQSDLESL